MTTYGKSQQIVRAKQHWETFLDAYTDHNTHTMENKVLNSWFSK